MRPQLRTTYRKEGQWVVVKVHGDVDLATGGQLAHYLTARIDEGCLCFILDLTDVAFLDSVGIGVVVRLHKRLMERGGEVRLVIAQRDLLRLFTLTGLHTVFAIYGSVDAAKTGS
jgi:anti-sigma B factor antagonist